MSVTPGQSAARIPYLLEFAPSDPHSELWRLDPRDPDHPAPLTVPVGRWQPTAGATAVGLASVGASPTLVRVTHLVGDQLVPSRSIALPAADKWVGAFVACLSPRDQVALADAAENLYLVASGDLPTLIPGQRLGLGGCTWLDKSTLVFDREDDTLMLSSPIPARATVTAIRGRGPSSGGGRLAWVEPSETTVSVSTFALSDGRLVLGREIGRVPGDAGSLAAGGTWLLTDDGAVGTVYAVGPSALTMVASFATGDGVRLSWLPAQAP